MKYVFRVMPDRELMSLAGMMTKIKIEEIF